MKFSFYSFTALPLNDFSCRFAMVFEEATLAVSSLFVFVCQRMEMAKPRNNLTETSIDFEFISQDLSPWDDIELALNDKADALPHNLTDAQICSGQEFHPDDLSLFNVYSISLPSVLPQPVCETNVKAITYLVEDNTAATGTDTETDIRVDDLGCPDDISLSSQMEDIVADILGSSVVPHCNKDLACDDKREMNVIDPVMTPALHAGLVVCMEQSEGPYVEKYSNAKNDESSRTIETFAEYTTHSSPIQQIEMVVADRSSSMQAGHSGDVGSRHDNRLDVKQHASTIGHQCAYENEAEGMTDSQKWIYDQLHEHLVNQHNEASRVNSLRVPLPSGIAIAPVRRNPVSRAIHGYNTQLDVMEFNMQLMNTLVADNPNISLCCKLLDEFSPYILSPCVLAHYPFFAGTIDVCCRWEGDLAVELHTAARRLRDFMMAMYIRNNVDESFLTVLDRQVTIIIYEYIDLSLCSMYYIVYSRKLTLNFKNKHGMAVGPG